MMAVLELYKSCKELPMLNFIAAFCNKDYSRLVKAGCPTATVLQQHWQQLLEEYLNLICDDKSLAVYKTEIEWCLQDIKLQTLQHIVKLLTLSAPYETYMQKMQVHLESINTLFDLGINLDLPMPQQLQQWSIALKEADMVYKELEAEHAMLMAGGDDTPGESSFYEWNSVLNKAGFNIQLAVTTVTEFVHHQKMYTKLIKHAKPNPRTD
ncbi:MAG: hypothetical protein SFU21_15170 [Flavihumibacter sp.]|nr:hypothetical protein [Flavihumibacter sp.]